MDPEVVDVLKRLKADSRQDKLKLVFPWMYLIWSQPSQRTLLAYQFRWILREAKIPREYSFHSYRHAFISRLLNAGVDVKIIQSMTGQSLRVLYDYVTVTPDAQRAALDKARPLVMPKEPQLQPI